MRSLGHIGLNIRVIVYENHCRTRYFDKHHIHAIVDEIRGALESDYYVKAESDHIHVSFKPLTLTG